jgi:hypothetical protein
MKLAVLALLCAVFAGCAAQPTPSSKPVAATQSTAPVARTAAAPVDGKLTPEKLMQLQREGYKIVDRNGEQYFCRTEKKTGSQIARDTVCMTAAEVDALRELTQRRMGEIQRNVPPPAGK